MSDRPDASDTMPLLRVEQGERTRAARCDRCGGRLRWVNGFVYRDDDAHGVYFLDWCEGDHGEPRIAYLTLSLGEFDEGTTAEDRLAVGIEWGCEGMSLADTPLRVTPQDLGRFVPGVEVPGLASSEGIWQVADQIVTEDSRAAAVSSWLCAETSAAAF